MKLNPLLKRARTLKTRQIKTMDTILFSKHFSSDTKKNILKGDYYHEQNRTNKH